MPPTEVFTVAGRLLYGYKLAPGGRVVVDSDAAVVVCAVLLCPSQRRFGPAMALVRKLLQDRSESATAALVLRIRRHAWLYRSGIARQGSIPELRLVIAGLPTPVPTIIPASHCQRSHAVKTPAR